MKTLSTLTMSFVIAFVFNISSVDFNKAEAGGCIYNGSANTMKVIWKNASGKTPNTKWNNQSLTAGFKSCWGNNGHGIAHIKPTGLIGSISNAQKHALVDAVALIHGACNSATKNGDCAHAGSFDAVDQAIKDAIHRMNGAHVVFFSKAITINICGAAPNIWYKKGNC